MTEDEEYARSELYGVLSMLFYGPPSQAVLELIEDAAIEGDGVLADAWRGLQAASSQTTAERAKEEYESLFIGVGKSEVMLYGSYYLSGFLMEKPLLALRSDLARLGLERSENLSESEDHFAALCDAMRLLHGNIATQKEFFTAHIQPWAHQLFDAIDAHPGAAYYRAVAGLARGFVDVEGQAFDMA
ncbi:TorD/DmsD family molecular chaperone [Pseudoduganella violaceinigra]|uniref:TorD/DmsD family molecular chaperone n=1 Tax=Pseudoduganella violaceinigra TaxID=246602 RepID=UPI0004064C36|nr:molecular chaperone TorD family protein [Pseudoduganella violaceinigra]